MAKKRIAAHAHGEQVVAKTDDGTVQINFTIPWEEIAKAQNIVVAESAKDIQIAGFRKGKAPLSKVIQRIPQSTLVEKTLNRILPHLLGHAIMENKLRLAIYPKYELISTKKNEPWQVRAVSCELPQVQLGKYKPAKSNKTPQEKEQIVIDNILKTTKVEIPKILIDEEVNSRLSKLLERIEKLGLSLEQYIGSIGKNITELKKDYEKQAKDALILDLALPQIAIKEGIKVDGKEVDAAIKASGGDPTLENKLNSPQQRSIVKAVLTKRATIDKLISQI